MTAHLLTHGVDEGEGAVRILAWLKLSGINPCSEELSSKVACASGGEVDHASRIFRCDERAGEVPGFIDEALWRVYVAVDDEGRGVDLYGIGSERRHDNVECSCFDLARMSCKGNSGQMERL